MKLKALRLREVGRFSEPVQIEGFSGGLDVLIAPNEAGKSTLLKALKAVFLEKHTSAGQKISCLRPYTGGAPLIEVDFEADGRSWRLRKQFLSDRGCSLVDLGSTRVVARGEEAHAQALELFSGGTDVKDMGVAGFLLLEQGMQLDEVAPSEKAQTAIDKVLEVELASTAGLTRLRHVLANAREDLAKFVTPLQLRPTGVLKAAIERRDGLKARLEGARRSEAEVAARQERLASLAAERTAHLDRERTAALLARVRLSAADLEAAGKAREALARAEAAYREHEASHRLAEAEAKGAREQLGELACLDKMLSETGAALSAAENKLQSRLASAAEARSRQEAAKSRLDAARRALDALNKAERRAEQDRRLADLSARLARLADLKVARTALANELKSLPAGEQTIKAAEAETLAILALEARIAAVAPSVTFDLQPSAAARVRVDGATVRSGDTVRPSAALRIDIEGIGSITVMPARSDDADGDAADRDAHQRALAGILGRAGVKCIEELRANLELRRNVERELSVADGRIEAVAPQGAGGLERDACALRALLEAAGPANTAPLPDRVAAEAAATAAELELAAATHDHAAAGEAVFREREALSALKAECETVRRRKAALGAALPPVADRQAWLGKLADRLADAERILKEASLERGAAREIAPDEAAFRRLADARAAAESEQRRWERRREELDREIAVLDGLLERDREAGQAAVSEGLARELSIAEREVAAQEADAAALRLLIDAAGDVERSTRDALLRPVLERVAAYLEPVLPGAEVDLQAGLIVSGLSRSGRSEDLSALSQGTREQIAVLVRLGVARLLADRGVARPFILDDVLVYSDDTRLSGMFENLKGAAGHHQVVVLSCRGRAFDSLGGNRLKFQPWTAH